MEIFGLLIVVGVIYFLVWKFKTKPTVLHSSTVTNVINIHLFVDDINSIKEIKTGDTISLWKPNNTLKLIAFASGSVGGKGKLGELNPKDAKVIIPLMEQGMGKKALVTNVNYNKIIATYPAP
jgi:hypothetical protein